MAQASKRDQILEAAGKLFIENGFQAVSVDQIAAAVPVSKPTLYAHFNDKRDLFQAVIEDRCATVVGSFKAIMGTPEDPQNGLATVARYFIDLLLTKSSLQFHRVMVAEGESFPEMAEMFYETGPKQMHALLRDYLSAVDGVNALSIPDPSMSADIFIGMIKGRTHLRCLLGVEKGEISREYREKLIRSAVEIFVRGHARI